MPKNWKYQMSSLYATEFAAVGLLPAKVAQFKSKTEFLHQWEHVSCTKPTQKLVPGKQSGPLAPHPALQPTPPAGPHGFGSLCSFPMLKGS